MNRRGFLAMVSILAYGSITSAALGRDDEREDEDGRGRGRGRGRGGDDGPDDGGGGSSSGHGSSEERAALYGDDRGDRAMARLREDAHDMEYRERGRIADGDASRGARGLGDIIRDILGIGDRRGP